MPNSLRERVTKHLIEAMGLPEADADELLALAQAMAASALESFAAQLDARDLEGLAETAHSLKGNLLNMGLDELAQLAKAVETGAKGGDLEAAAQGIQGLQAALSGF